MQNKQNKSSVPKQVNNKKQRNQGQRPGQQKQQSKVARSERAPVAIGNKTYQSGPRYRNMGENMCVSHREYVADIIGSTSAFAVAAAFPMNPGMPITFPWLNQIASRYESYKFLKCKWSFKTERPTTESGYIALVPDFDATDPQPTSKSSAFQYESTAKAAPWENVTSVLRSQDLLKRKSYYVRQGALNASETLDLYDTGNLFVCVGGNSGAVTLGELWCDYEVCFMTPQLDSNYVTNSAKVVGGTAQTAALPFGTAPVITYGRSDLFTYNSTTGEFTFLISYEGLVVILAAGTVLSAASLAGGTTVTSTSLGTVANGTNTSSITHFAIQATPGQIMDVSLTATTVTSCTMRVGNYSYTLA